MNQYSHIKLAIWDGSAKPCINVGGVGIKHAFLLAPPNGGSKVFVI